MNNHDSALNIASTVHEYIKSQLDVELNSKDR